MFAPAGAAVEIVSQKWAPILSGETLGIWTLILSNGSSLNPLAVSGTRDSNGEPNDITAISLASGASSSNTSSSSGRKLLQDVGRVLLVDTINCDGRKYTSAIVTGAVTLYKGTAQNSGLPTNGAANALVPVYSVAVDMPLAPSGDYSGVFNLDSSTFNTFLFKFQDECIRQCISTQNFIRDQCSPQPMTAATSLGGAINKFCGLPPDTIYGNIANGFCQLLSNLAASCEAWDHYDCQTVNTDLSLSPALISANEAIPGAAARSVQLGSFILDQPPPSIVGQDFIDTSL